MEPLRTQSLEIVDDAGNVRARLGVGADGAVALDLADARGMVRATVRVEPEDGSASVKLADAHGTYRAALGTWPDRTSGLDLYDVERRHRVSVAEDDGGLTGTNVFDRAGHLRASVALGQPGEREASAEFWDARGAYRAGFGAWPDGGTGTELLDADGGLRARFGQRAEGPATVELYDGRGGFRAAMGEYPDGAGRLSLWDAHGRPISGRVA